MLSQIIDNQNKLLLEKEQRITDLEKELEQAKKVQVVEHFEAYGQCRDSRRIASLEKENEELNDKLNNLSKVAEIRLANWQKYEQENAELKAKLKPENCLKLLAKEGYIKSSSEQLTKAKELIRQLCLMVRELNNPNVQLTNVDYSLKEAEQFLKESE